jgi:hypothetical protein
VGRDTADIGGIVLVRLNALRLLGYFSGDRASRGA